LLACLSVVMVILMAVPMAASAASGIQSTQWSGAVFMGTDDFYGTGVVAFEAGSAAKLTALVKNEAAVDATIKEAKIKFDWGVTVTATSAPTQLKSGETGVFVFDFTVPETTVATNTSVHNYQVIVGYQNQGTSYVKDYNPIVLFPALGHTRLGVGDGANKDFSTGSAPVLTSSLKVYLQNTTVSPNTVALQDPSSYAIDARAGKITFSTAPAAGVWVYAEYTSFEWLGTGTGTNNVFYTASSPVVDGSLQVYIANDTAETFVQATGWSFDTETGKITLASSPGAYESVYATYTYSSRWATVTGNDFVVYSADQADAIGLSVTYDSMNTNYPAYLFTPGTVAAKAAEEAEVSNEKADAEYENGDFAAAKTDYDAAVTGLQSAIDADATLNTPVETALMGLLSGADDAVNAFAHKMDGQASMAKNIGVFYIMLGVAVLLAGLAGLLWAYSRLVAAKGPRQQM
jgi:hypothetical protein